MVKVALDDRIGKPIVHHMPFEEYSELYKDFFRMRREDGIIEVRAHTNDGPVVFTTGFDMASAHVPGFVGDDVENEVVIVTGTGDKFIGSFDRESVMQLAKDMMADPGDGLMRQFDRWLDGRGRVENWVWDLHVPTIGVINGPSMGGALPFLWCDIILCAEDVEINEPHFKTAVVPGDGNFSMLQYKLGDTRANYMTYLAKPISSENALKLGLVNEVLPREQLLPRAWEIAREIMQQPRHIRRMTHELMRQRVLRYLMDDFLLHTSFEWWGSALASVTNLDRLQNRLAEIEAAEKAMKLGKKS